MMIERLRGLLRRRVVQNVIALYVVRAINQLLPLAVIPFLARVLEPAGWGLVAFTQAFAVYGIVVIEYGFHLAGTRAVAQAREDPQRLGALAAGILCTQFLLALLVAVAALVIRSFVPAFQDQPLLLWAGLVFAVLQGFSPGWYFIGLERIPLIASIDTGAKILGTIAIFLLVEGKGDGWIVLAAFAGAALISTAMAYALLLRDVRPARPSIDLVRETLRLGFNLFVMRIAVLMHTAGNMLLLGLLVAPQQVAFFAAGEKLCRPMAWLMHPINVALLPRLSHLVGASPDRADALAGLTVMVMAVISLGMGLAVATTAPWLIAILFGARFEAAIPVMRVLAMTIPLVVLNGALISQWMVPRGLDRWLNLIVWSAAAINLALALVVAPIYKAMGMAWVTVLVEFYILAGLVFALQRSGARVWQPQLLRRSVGWLLTGGNAP